MQMRIPRLYESCSRPGFRKPPRIRNPVTKGDIQARLTWIEKRGTQSISIKNPTLLHSSTALFDRSRLPDRVISFSHVFRAGSTWLLFWDLNIRGAFPMRRILQQWFFILQMPRH